MKRVSEFNVLFFFFVKLQLIDEALNCTEKSKFLVVDKIKQFENFGGVRIEDDVLITETGCENFAIVPRTYVYTLKEEKKNHAHNSHFKIVIHFFRVEEIEAWMAA